MYPTVEVVTATVDIEEVRAYRSQPSRGVQSLHAPTFQRIETDFSLGTSDFELDLDIAPSPRIDIRIHEPAEEISLSAACWLWDYLRRSGAGSYHTQGIRCSISNLFLYSWIPHPTLRGAGQL